MNIKKGIVTDVNQKAITVSDIETGELTVIQYQEFGDMNSDEIYYLSPYNHPNIYKGAEIEYMQNNSDMRTSSSGLIIGALAGETIFTPEIDKDLDELKQDVNVVIDRVIPSEVEKDGELITLYEGFATGIPSYDNYRFRAGTNKVSPGDIWNAVVFKKDRNGSKCFLKDKLS